MQGILKKRRAAPPRMLLMTMMSALSSVAMASSTDPDPSSASGQTPPDAPEDLLPMRSPWTPLYTVQAGAGWRDNVLLSSFDRRESVFLRGSLELFLTRLPWDGRSVDVYLFWEHAQFLGDVPIEREQLGFAQVHLKQDLSEGMAAGLDLEYFHQNQVVDVSVTEAQPTIVQVRGHGLSGKPSYRVSLPGATWLSVEAPVYRQYYADPLDPYLEFGPGLTWGLSYGHESRMEWSYGYVVREYDSYEALSRQGAILPDTSRVFRQHEAAWEWVHYWDADHRWQSTTRLSLRRNQDAGGGYFDYHRYRFYHRLRYRSGPWTGTIRGRLSHYQYDHQTVSLADLEKRRRTEFSVTARGERQILPHLNLYAEYVGEWIRGNVRSEEYRVGTVVTGLLWEF